MFYREKAIARAVKNYRMDDGKGHTGGSGGHAFVSDPTAIAGIKNATEIRCVTLDDGSVVYHPEKWLIVVRETYRHLDGLQKEAMKLRYEGEKSYIIQAELGISKDVFYVIKSETIKYAIAAACQIGLIKVY
jgi:hypothetical protein